MINIENSKKIIPGLVLLLVVGCSQKSPKSIDSTQVNLDSPSHHSVFNSPSRYKKTIKHKEIKKRNFTEKDLIWDRLLSLYALPEVDDPRVERELEWFIDHPDYIARVQQRSEPYLYQILNEIEAHNMPGELALLPVVESAFKPDAVSSAAAAGLWQFMPGTGRDYGLEQNWWYDGRHDIYASTQAAASYLQSLSEDFGGDWCLALASYNYGKANIQRAIDRNIMQGEPSDYWSLRGLPQETAQYVPKLLAVAKLFAHAEEYGIPLQSIYNKPVFEVVEVGSPLYLDHAAAMANTSHEHLLKLNPAFKRDSTAPDGPHHLLIPVAHVDTFKENLSRIPSEQKQQFTYAIRNQYLDMLAARRAEELERQARKAEAERLARIAQEERMAAIKAAQEEKRAQEALAALERKKAAQILLLSKKAKKSPEHHESTLALKKGERQLELAAAKAAHEDSKSALHGLNKAQEKASAKHGKPQLVASTSNGNPFHTVQYVVKKGESLNGIARKFNVSISEIRKWNSDKAVADLRPGQKIKVIVDAGHPVT